RQDPGTLTGVRRDSWDCSPYANSIAYQLREALPNVRVEQIRPVEQNQGKVLSRVTGLMLLLSLAALLAAALAVSAAMAATILERRQGVGLMKSLGAGNSAVSCTPPVFVRTAPSLLCSRLPWSRPSPQPRSRSIPTWKVSSATSSAALGRT